MTRAAAALALCLVACGQSDGPPAADAAASSAKQAERAKAGPYLSRDTAISPTERAKVVVVPAPSGSPHDDKVCVVYVNSALQAPAMHCDSNMLSGDEYPRLSNP